MFFNCAQGLNWRLEALQYAAKARQKSAQTSLRSISVGDVKLVFKPRNQQKMQLTRMLSGTAGRSHALTGKSLLGQLIFPAFFSRDLERKDLIFSPNPH